MNQPLRLSISKERWVGFLTVNDHIINPFKCLIRLISVTIFNFNRCVQQVWRQSILSAYNFISGMSFMAVLRADPIRLATQLTNHQDSRL